MGYADTGWLGDGARTKEATACSPTVLFNERVHRTPQGMAMKPPSNLHQPSEAPVRPDSLPPGKNREWPWWLGTTLRPQSKPNGGGSISLVAEMSSVCRSDSGRYGTYTNMDIWRPGCMGDELKGSEEILREASQRDYESRALATSLDVEYHIRRKVLESRHGTPDGRQLRGGLRSAASPKCVNEPPPLNTPLTRALLTRAYLQGPDRPKSPRSPSRPRTPHSRDFQPITRSHSSPQITNLQPAFTSAYTSAYTTPPATPPSTLREDKYNGEVYSSPPSLKDASQTPPGVKGLRVQLVRSSAEDWRPGSPKTAAAGYCRSSPVTPQARSDRLSAVDKNSPTFYSRSIFRASSQVGSPRYAVSRAGSGRSEGGRSNLSQGAPSLLERTTALPLSSRSDQIRGALTDNQLSKVSTQSANKELLHTYKFPDRPAKREKAALAPECLWQPSTYAEKPRTPKQAPHSPKVQNAGKAKNNTQLVYSSGASSSKKATSQSVDASTRRLDFARKMSMGY